MRQAYRYDHEKTPEHHLWDVDLKPITYDDWRHKQTVGLVRRWVSADFVA